MKIRKANETERSEILNVHKQAFGIYGEDKGIETSELVNNLLNDATAMPMLSLVAIEDDKIIGHILYTKVTITGSDAAAQLLAPLAVLSEHHKTGVGQKLVKEGLKQLKESGTELVFVLGHPDYYPQCGFAPAGEQGFEAPYYIPPENADAWMVQGLSRDAVSVYSGKVKCASALDEPQYWRE